MSAKRGLRVILLCLLVALYGFLLAHFAARESGALLSAVSISPDEAGKLKAGRSETTVKELGGLQLSGCELPYSSADDIWYLPQQLGQGDIEGVLQAARQDVTLYLTEDPYYRQKEKAIRENHVFSFTLTTHSSYATGKLVFTGLPALVLRPEYEDEQGVWQGTAVVFENGQGTSPYDARRLKAGYHIRGGTSRNLPKVGYRLELKKLHKKKDSLSLLGMREDNDWILCPMYADINRVRDKLCTDLWNELCSQTSLPGTRMRYIELFIGDSYEGIYGLMEPVDYQQLDLEKGRDVLYKTRTWDVPTGEQYAQSSGSSVCLGIEIKTDAMPDYSALWEPCARYTGLMFGESVEDFEEAIDSGVCPLDNILDIGLFTEAICGSDNKFKNQYLAAMPDGEGWIYRRTLWDMDLSFGLYYDSDYPTNTAFSMKRTTKRTLDTVFERLLSTGKYQQQIAQRWKALRENGLTAENIGEKADTYAKLLTDSGAFDRELARWPDGNESLDLEDLKQFARERFAYLDGIYGGEVQDAGISK